MSTPHGAAFKSGVAPAAIVFCERLDNESFCESVIRELGEFYDVRPCGPGWEAKDLADVDQRGVRFYLELDSASGSFVRPTNLARLSCPKFAWLIDTHKKPSFHAEIARDMDVTFHAHKVWGHVFRNRAEWLPLHADERIFHPVECERDLDLVFVGSQEWRADSLRRIAAKHNLKLHASCTTGAREKSETAALYARAKLVFNRHCANDLNFRVFEALACGRVLLTDAQWNGQYDLLEDGRHYHLYKDERDLERMILALLADDAARTRIERAAAEVASQHTTRARVRQLVAAIERVVEERGSPPVSGPRRWLFFVGDEPPTIERKSYAERLAAGLARAGEEVVVARARRGSLSRPKRHAPGEPLVVELDLGPIPQAATDSNRRLGIAGALHGAFARVVAERGPFDAFVGEAALGGLVVQPVAERQERPFFLALDECEVARHGNRLTREQVSTAELEHWFVDRAAAVLVPRREVEDSVASFYRSARTCVVEVPRPRVDLPRDAERLAGRLGLSGPFTLVFSPHEGEREKGLLLRGSLRETLVLVTDDVRVRLPEGGTVALARRAPRGSALQALVARAARVVTVATEDPRCREAWELGYAVAEVPADEALTKGAARLEDATPRPPRERATEDLSALVALVSEKVNADAPEVPLALLQ